MRRFWTPLARKVKSPRKKHQGLQAHDARLEALEQRQMLSISATDDAYAANYNTAVSGNVRNNDVAGTGAFLLSNPSHGSLGSSFQSSGAFTYTPTSGYTGSDSFSYLLVDALESRPTISDPDPSNDITDAVGNAVAVSGDWAVVGAKWDDEAGTNAGAAYVFRLENGAWTKKQKLVPTSISQDANFGYSVSIEGSRILVGAPYDDANSKAQSGSVYAYEFDGLQWGTPQKLTLDSSVAQADDWFGNSVDLDATQAVIGAPQRDDNSLGNSGSAYVYNFTVANGWSYGTRLNPNSGDRGAGDLFGMSVSIDGNRIIVGADGDDANTGSAFIFDNATSWSQTAKLVASDRLAGDLFGWFVAVSGDRVIVGAREADIGGYSNVGAAYLYEKSGSSWVQTKLVSGESQTNVYFGWAVGIDGETVVVGGYGYDQVSLQDVGAAYVFRKLNGAWPQTNKLASNIGQASVNGAYSVAAIDGDMIVSGLPFADTAVAVNFGAVAFFKLYQDIGTVTVNVLPSGTTVAAIDDRFTLTEGGTTTGANVFTNDLEPTAGGAYVSRNPTNGSVTAFDMWTGAFTYAPTGSFFGTDAFTYTLRQLTAQQKRPSNIGSTNQAYAHFGLSVAMDGDVAVIGAPYEDNGAAVDVGAIYVLRWNGSDWVLDQKIWGEAAGDLFGYDVAMHRNRIAVGAFFYGVGGLDQSGAAYVLQHDGTAWSTPNSGNRLVRSVASNGNYWFGRSVDISGDTLVVGAPFDNVAGTNSGAVYTFNWNGTSWGQEGTLVPGGTNHSAFDQLGQSVAIDGSTIVAGAVYDDPIATSDTGSAFVFENTSGSWSFVKRLFTTGGGSSDQFGWSVDVSGEFIAVGARWRNIGTVVDAGSVYMFKKVASAWGESPTQTLQPAVIDGDDSFGFDVALDGDTLVVGAYLDDDSGTDAGAAYVFRYDGATWQNRHKPLSPSLGGWAGYGVGAVWGDKVLIGIPWDSASATQAGSVFFCNVQNASVLLTVVPGVNNPPTSKAFSPLTVSEDAPDSVLQLLEIFTDLDVGSEDSLTFNLNNSNSTLLSASVVGTALILDFKDDASGTANVTVEVRDSSGAEKQEVLAVTVNAAADLPRIATLETSASVIGRNEPLILTANGVADPDTSDSITTVTFYRDTNGNGILDASDQNLGAGTYSSTSKTATLTVADTVTAQFEDGQQTYFAVATSRTSGSAIDQVGAAARVYGEVYGLAGAPRFEPVAFPKTWENRTFEHQFLAINADGLQYRAELLAGPAGQDGDWFTEDGLAPSTGLVVATPPSGSGGEYVFLITLVEDAGTPSERVVASVLAPCRVQPTSFYPFWDGTDPGNEVTEHLTHTRTILVIVSPLEDTPVDFTIWFKDGDDLAEDLTMSFNGRLPTGLSWAKVIDVGLNRVGARISGT